MSALLFESQDGRARIGMKGPRAEEWLADRGIVLPAAPNSWAGSTAAGNSTGLLVARLGTSEFFLEDAAEGTLLQGIRRGLEENPPGVYPVLREDAAFQLSGDGVHDVLAQVCNVHFAALRLGFASADHDAHARRCGPRRAPGTGVSGADAERRYRIWCDPTFGPFLGEAVGGVVVECGGTLRGLSA